MPRGTRIPPAERRDWLDKYERGDRVDKIAREAGRTERTVQSHLSRERRERDHQQVMAGLLRDAYQNHYVQLLNQADELSRAAEQPDLGGIQLGTDFQTRALCQGLKSHIPRSPLWAAIKDWDRYAKDLVAESDSVRSSLKGIAEAGTRDLPNASVEGISGSLWDAMMMEAEGRKPSLTEYRVERSGSLLQLSWGSFLLGDQIENEVEVARVEEAHKTLLLRMRSPEWATELPSLVSRWGNARDAIQEETALLRLRQILPGHCDLCPGGEVTRTRRPNRRVRNAEG